MAAGSGAGGDRSIRISHIELLQHAVQRKFARYRGVTLVIHCRDLRVVEFRDAIDLFLHLARASTWRWTDENGRLEVGSSVHRSALRLLREGFWNLPIDYARHVLRNERLLRGRPPRSGVSDPDRGLYIRADHWFGVQSGGSVGHVAGVITGLRRRGVRLDVVSTDELVGVAADAGFHLLRPQYDRIRNLPELSKLSYNDRLWRFLASRWDVLSPDFVYYRYSLNNYIGPYLRARYGVPTICEYNGSMVWMNRHWAKRSLYFERMAARIERLNLEQADLIVVVSKAMADTVTARGIPAERVLVNPNGVDPDRYSPAVSGDGVRRSLGFEDRIVVGFIGTFGTWHGVEKLVEAAALLFRDPEAPPAVDRLHFLLVGDGLRMPEVRSLLAREGLDSRFTLTGRIPQEQGPAHLAAMDILASPHVPTPDGTPFFGSPTKLFEYMAMGKPIIASDLDQIGEVLEHDRTAWLVTPGDAVALARGIRDLLERPEHWRRLGDSARVEAISRFTWDAHCRRILDAFHDRVRCGASRRAD